MLNEFVIQFDKAVDTRRAAEEDEDFKTMNSMPVLSSIHPIKAKGECYTKKIFELYQKEYKGGNASIGIEETNSENEVSALALWYVQANLTKAIEQARDAPFEIKRLNSFLVEFLEDQMIRKKPTEIENAYKVARVGISQVDMMPQISVRDPDVLTILKGRPRNATRVKPPIEVKQKKTVTCSYCRKPGHNITGFSGIGTIIGSDITCRETIAEVGIDLSMTSLEQGIWITTASEVTAGMQKTSVECEKEVADYIAQIRLEYGNKRQEAFEQKQEHQ
ncbi:hypothetical protein Tco_1326161 [Tanacetum coccineum]